MAAASETSPQKGIILPTDILYLLTFTVGMAAFWVSGHASSLLPVMKSGTLRTIAGMAVTGGVYGLGILLLALIATRRIMGTLLATVLAIVLGLATAQLIVHLATGHIHSKSDLGILTFVLYLFYGGIYVISLAVARKFAK